jgi:hypothetical protein
MSEQIWKFKLQTTGYISNGVVSSIAIPIGAKVIAAGVKDNWVCLWALVDIGNDVGLRRFVIYGTGHDIEHENIAHVDSFQSGSLVFHVFEVLP